MQFGVEIFPRVADVEVIALVCSVNIDFFAVFVFAIVDVVALEITGGFSIEPKHARWEMALGRLTLPNVNFITLS